MTELLVGIVENQIINCILFAHRRSHASSTVRLHGTPIVSDQVYNLLRTHHVTYPLGMFGSI